ncbi:Cellobiose 2-epimerase [Commensalibacter sp. Nvir]|uniref:AGE family epimerase/isomerase n=1 Tax=Commensalibacter sp. Nvir TaxID=3069817 RepID=UPI002D50034C|nr:Cellobiose 2-epimerase [Commensalibacter sp. Nvir]
MMKYPSYVIRKYEQFSHWLFNYAFPYWGEIGCDGPKNNPHLWGAHEQLKLDGSPDFPGYKRMRVQARQLYSFTQAAMLGWSQGNKIAEYLYQFIKKGLIGEGQWAKTLTREGQVLDNSSDLYDLAFIIFSLSWYARLSGDIEPIRKARQTVRWIKQYMACPRGGFKNVYPSVQGYRQQNPHMHLLEAALALYETTQCEKDLQLIDDLVRLFCTVFFDRRTNIVHEYYEEDWRLPPSHLKINIEPGHQYEWIWLLSECERLTGKNHFKEIQLLYSFNMRHAIDVITGLVCDEVSVDGIITNKSSRLWVQTEAIRASSLMRDEKSHIHLTKIIHNLLNRYFVCCPKGTWQDQLDENCAYKNKIIPTSSFYHIVSSYAQLHQSITYPRYPQLSPQYTAPLTIKNDIINCEY